MGWSYSNELRHYPVNRENSSPNGFTNKGNTRSASPKGLLPRKRLRMVSFSFQLSINQLNQTVFNLIYHSGSEATAESQHTAPDIRHVFGTQTTISSAAARQRHEHANSTRHVLIWTLTSRRGTTMMFIPGRFNLSIQYGNAFTKSLTMADRPQSRNQSLLFEHILVRLFAMGMRRTQRCNICHVLVRWDEHATIAANHIHRRIRHSSSRSENFIKD